MGQPTSPRSKRTHVRHKPERWPRTRVPSEGVTSLCATSQENAAPFGLNH